mmetsp:Transcript_5870/g.13928  ORF Transcript_5870/g.13928 Transcript_5870/m.13928 type:complete len:167 (-) Transcript_5870:1911-2411(-)
MAGECREGHSRATEYEMASAVSLLFLFCFSFFCSVSFLLIVYYVEIDALLSTTTQTNSIFSPFFCVFQFFFSLTQTHTHMHTHSCQYRHSPPFTPPNLFIYCIPVFSHLSLLSISLVCVKFSLIPFFKHSQASTQQAYFNVIIFHYQLRTNANNAIVQEGWVEDGR